MTRAERIQDIKKQLRSARLAMDDSKHWTENQAGGWEILARGNMDTAEQLLRIVEEDVKMRKYMVYLEDRDNVYRIAVPARDQEDAIRWVEGNGDLVAVKDVTDDYQISADRVAEALLSAGFGKVETDFILRALDRSEMTV